MIKIINLSKQYPGNKEKTLNDITFSFPDTGLFYIIGKSGSGKTTFLNIISAIDYDYDGSVMVSGQELSKMNEKEKALLRFSKISHSFQEYNSDENDTVNHNLLKILAITDLTHKEKESRIRYYLEKVELTNKLNAKFKTLSGGEKKRISLVRALICSCPILLADEPLSSLNKKLRKKITALLETESQNRLIIIITHEKAEIDDNSNILELKNGKLSITHKASVIANKPLTCIYHRKEYKGWTFWSDVFRSISEKSQFMLITLFSIAISLFSISFSLLLSNGVNSSLTESLNQYMSENTMVVSQDEDSVNNNGYETSDYQFLNLLKRNHEDKIIDISPFYLSNLGSIFQQNQAISIINGNRTFPLSSFSLDKFMEYSMFQEETISIDKQEIDYDEIIIGLDETTLESLYYFIFGTNIYEIGPSEIASLRFQLINKPLRIQASNPSWNYFLDYSLTIKGIYKTEVSHFIHSRNDFNEYFVNKIMFFKDCLEEEEINSSMPWTLKKGYGIRLYQNQIDSFLESFLHDSHADNYVLRPLNWQTYYQEENIMTHNRYLVYKDLLRKVSVSRVQQFASEHLGAVEEISYSTPIYTFTASGYISGFTKPFFFSKYKDKLNQIMDEANFSDENLGQFQATSIQTPENVIKADLLSASDKDGLRFKNTEYLQKRPYLGRKPKNCSEIAISSGFVKKTFLSDTEALNNQLNVLVLSETIKESDRYRNKFSEGSLLITGIYDDNEISIYQNTFFPLSYCFTHFPLSMNDIRISNALLKVNLDNHSPDYYIQEIKKYDNYQASFPMLSIVSEIRKTMSNLSLLFLGFSFISIILSSALLALSTFLIIKKDRKEIGILLSFGFRKSEISKFYLSFSLVVGLIGYLISLIITALTENIFKNTLQDLLSAYSFSPLPYLVSLGVGIALSIIVGLFSIRKLHAMSPRDALN
ncbi:MAG: ATP-binding cassette domain-containing protein [Bacilli bacterium]